MRDIDIKFSIILGDWHRFWLCIPKVPDLIHWGIHKKKVLSKPFERVAKSRKADTLRTESITVLFYYTLRA